MPNTTRALSRPITRPWSQTPAGTGNATSWSATTAAAGPKATSARRSSVTDRMWSPRRSVQLRPSGSRAGASRVDGLDLGREARVHTTALELRGGGEQLGVRQPLLAQHLHLLDPLGAVE